MSKKDKAALAKGAGAIRKAEGEARAIKLGGKIADVVAEIKRLYGEVQGLEIRAARESYSISFGAWKKSLPAAIRIGELLCRVKNSPGWHGKWLGWLKKNVPFDVRTAQRYMKVYRRRDELPEFLKRSEFSLAEKTTVSYLTDAYLRLTKPRTGRRAVIEEMEAKGIPESVTRKFYAEQDETARRADLATPAPVPGNERPEPQAGKAPKGWTPSPLALGDLTGEERELLKRLASREPGRRRALVRGICEGGLLEAIHEG